MLSNTYVRIAIIIVLVIILYYLVITLARNVQASESVSTSSAVPESVRVTAASARDVRVSRTWH
jgi:hypothetical protein